MFHRGSVRQSHHPCRYLACAPKRKTWDIGYILEDIECRPNQIRLVAGPVQNRSVGPSGEWQIRSEETGRLRPGMHLAATDRCGVGAAASRRLLQPPELFNLPGDQRFLLCATPRLELMLSL